MSGRSNFLYRFWLEIKRRNVHRSLAVYAGTAYCFLEASTIIFPRWGFPDWAIDVLLYLLILGGVVTIFVSWVFDVTPEGIKKTRPIEEVPEDEKTTVTNSWKVATYASLIVIIALIVFNVFSRNRVSDNLTGMENSIAVLPFENLIPDSSEQWFTEGISDVISSQLTKISEFRIINRNSTNYYKAEEKSVAEMGQELGVNYIILGTAQKMGNRIRIIVTLVSVNNETQLWSDIYDKEWEDIFDIQTDIATKIASNLQTILTPEETRQIENFGTENREAYEYILVGDYLISHSNFSEDNYLKAIDNYKQAIELDPDFAQAYARLSSAYYELTMWSVPDPDASFIPVAEKYANIALEIDNNMGEAYYVLGAIKFMHDNDFEDAEKAFQKGTELSPDYVWGQMVYANFLTIMGRPQESILICEPIMKMDPLNPLIYVELGFALAHNGQYDKAHELYNRCLELVPNYLNALGCREELYCWEGTYNDELSNSIDTLLGSPPYDIQNTATDKLMEAAGILSSVDLRVETYDILNELNHRIEAGESVSHFELGKVYNNLGDKDKALDLFEEGFNRSESDIYFNGAIKMDDPIRADKRFQELLRKMGFIW